MKVEFELVTQEDFPHGLRCGMCSRSLLPGQPFTDTMDGMIGNDAVTILICVYC